MKSKAVQTHDPIRIRPLKKGEWVDYSEIGVPGVQLTGSAVKVAIHSDGTMTACMIPEQVLEQIEVFVFTHLIIYSIPIRRHEFRFLRTSAGLTAKDTAKLLGMSESEIVTFEEGGGRLSIEREATLRGHLLPKMVELVGSLNPGIREANRRHIEKAQGLVTASEAKRDDLACLPFTGRSAVFEDGTIARVNSEQGCCTA